MDTTTYGCKDCNKIFEDYDTWGLTEDLPVCPFCGSHSVFFLTEEGEDDTVDGLPDFDPDDDAIDGITGQMEDCDDD